LQLSEGKIAGFPLMKAYNNRRLFEPIGHIPPAEAEANSYAAFEERTSGERNRISTTVSLGRKPPFRARRRPGRAIAEASPPKYPTFLTAA
jgi:hypothetical protein